MKSLWPEELFKDTKDFNPLILLKKQAQFLANKTNNAVEGEVKILTYSDSFMYKFFVKSIILDSSYTLFRLSHSCTNPFPMNLIDYTDTEYQATDENSLKEVIKQIFKKEGTKNVIKTYNILSEDYND